MLSFLLNRFACRSVHQMDGMIWLTKSCLLSIRSDGGLTFRQASPFKLWPQRRTGQQESSLDLVIPDMGYEEVFSSVQLPLL
jgi:hypothetical protein